MKIAKEIITSDINISSPVIKIATPSSSSSVSKIPFVYSKGLEYYSSPNHSRGNFVSPEYDLSLPGKIIDTESMALQASIKKVALCFKEGWDIVGTNPKTVNYIRIRFDQISRATRLPTNQLLRAIGSSLILKSNACLLKVRKASASGGRVRKEGRTGRNLQPVAGYFPLPVETMEVEFGENGNPIKWKQELPSGTYKEYDPQDIILFTKDKKDGFFFGTPTITPVVDDIKALRIIEQNVELLIHQHLFPLFQFQVGTDLQPASKNENGESEIEVFRQEIENMSEEGGLVTSHRHKITAIGSEGRAVRAEGYLNHFKKRVIAGLGISSVDLGDSDTSTRSTADNMSRNLVDSVKDVQMVLEDWFTEFVINELLLESTFGESVLNPENRVYLKFKEIDIATQIKKEAHNADQFAKKIITMDEARLSIGKEPIQIPTIEESRSGVDLSEKYPAWSKTYWKLYEEPKALIQAIDEPYSAAAIAARDNPSLSISSPQLQKSKGSSEKQKEKVLKNSFLFESFLEAEEKIVDYLRKNDSYKMLVDENIKTFFLPMTDVLTINQISQFKKGYNNKKNINSFLGSIKLARGNFKERAEKIVDRLSNDVSQLVSRYFNDLKKEDWINTIKIIFEELSFRVKFLEDTELEKALNYGKLLLLKDRGDKEAKIILEDTNHKGSIEEEIIDLATVSLDSTPPFVLNRDYQIKINDNGSVKNETTQNIVKCKKCNNIIKRLNNSKTFICRSCKEVINE